MAHGAEGHRLHSSKTFSFIVQQFTLKMLNIQLFCPKLDHGGAAQLQECRGKQPGGSRMVTVHGRHRAHS